MQKVAHVYLNADSLTIQEKLKEQKIYLSDFVHKNINNFKVVATSEIGKFFKGTSVYEKVDKKNVGEIERISDKNGISKSHLVNLIINQNGQIYL